MKDRIKLWERIKAYHSISHMYFVMEEISAVVRRMMICQDLDSSFAKAVLYSYSACYVDKVQ